MGKNSLIFFIALALLITLLIWILKTDNKRRPDWEWSYSIENKIEKSQRSYMLVYRSQEQLARRIRVVSRCEKPIDQEGVYGKCSHEIYIQPGDTKFTLDSGEDVVLISSVWESSLIIGTIEYACCAGSNVVRFYSDTGEYFGQLDKIIIKDSSDNWFTRVFNLFNSARDYGKSNYKGEKKYFIVSDRENAKNYFALFKDNSGVIKKVPIIYTNPYDTACEWYFSDFIKYGDRNDLTFVLEGRFCNFENIPDRLYFSCIHQDTAIICSPRPKGKFER